MLTPKLRMNRLSHGCFKKSAPAFLRIGRITGAEIISSHTAMPGMADDCYCLFSVFANFTAEPSAFMMYVPDGMP